MIEPAWLTPIPADAGTRGGEVADFIETFVTLTKDSVAGSVGEPIVLRDWQRKLLDGMFATDQDGKFLHRTSVFSTGRKNGKTSLMAGIGLWSLFQHDQGGETYSCAAEKEQARITFGDARKIIEADSELKDLCKVYRDAIEVPSTGSVWRVLSAEAYSKDGLNASCVLFDEVASLQSREMWDVMQLSMASRRQPLMIAGSTCAAKTDSTGQNSTFYQLYEYGKRVATGEIADPSFFMSFWETPAEMDYRTEEAWKRGNPGFGDLCSAEDFASMVNRTPESEFRTKRCNQWVSSQTAWLPNGTWDACVSDRQITPDDEYVIGFDGSFANDATALVGITVPKDENDLPHIFLIRAWEKDPNIHGDDWRVDIQEVEQTIREFVAANPKCREIACDPFRWQRSMEILAEEGLPIVEWPSTSARRMIPACAKFFDSVVEKRVTHDGNPMLARHLGNAVVKSDAQGVRIVKESRASARRIDAAVAAVIGFDRAVSIRLVEQVIPEFFI